LSKNYWPHSIAFILLLGVIACAWTIKIALDNPVEMSNMFMQKYQNVDDNINELILSEKKFDSKYTIKMLNDNLRVGKNIISLELRDSELVQNATLIALITRPETTKFDQVIENVNFVDGQYKIENIDITKTGRWILRVQIKINDLITFKNFELIAS
jgi:hypothetical protein